MYLFSSDGQHNIHIEEVEKNFTPYNTECRIETDALKNQKIYSITNQSLPTTLSIENIMSLLVIDDIVEGNLII